VDTDAWKDWIGQVVVVDTNSNFVYIGTLARVLEHFVEMKDADAHDRGEGLSTKEQYVMEAKRFGVKPNRREVSIRKNSIVSLSRLDDVLLY
jgi:small nuclear ribonucleoprotein (snRNP)-like protein